MLAMVCSTAARCSGVSCARSGSGVAGGRIGCGTDAAVGDPAVGCGADTGFIPEPAGTDGGGADVAGTLTTRSRPRGASFATAGRGFCGFAVAAAGGGTGGLPTGVVACGGERWKKCATA